MITRLGRPLLGLFALAATSCSLGGSQKPAQAPPPSPPPPRTPATKSDVPRALVDLGKEQACKKLQDHFVPLDSESGGDQGKSVHAGRWWIRACDARAEGDRLTVHLRGPLWLWVEKTSTGFEVAQYVVFLADVTMTGTADAGYDPASEVVSVWFSPTATPQVKGQSLVQPSPKPEGLGVVLNAITLGNAQEIADKKAREKLQEEIPRTFREKLGRGLTLTVELKSMQIGSAMRPLPRGATPDRPFPIDDQTIADERQELHASNRGYQVMGPYDPEPRIELQVSVESGAGIGWRTGCQQDVDAWFAPVEQGRVPAVPDPSGGEGGAIRERSSTHTIKPPPCRWYLVTRSLAGTSDIALRLQKPDQRALPRSAPPKKPHPPKRHRAAGESGH